MHFTCPYKKNTILAANNQQFYFVSSISKDLCNTKSPTLNTASESDYLWSEQKSIC